MDFSTALHAVQRLLVEHPSAAPAAYVVLHVLSAALLLPCSPFTLAAGALWGKWLGLGISLLAAVTSSCVTFALSRWLLGERMRAYLGARYPSSNRVLDMRGARGWKYVAAVQLNPALPASTLGYLFGLTRIGFGSYVASTLLFMLPLQALLVLAGDSIADYARASRPLMAAGVLAAVATALLADRGGLRRASRAVNGDER